MSDSTVVRSIRLPSELLDRLRRQAAAESRTVNNLIIKTLTDALNSKETA